VRVRALGHGSFNQKSAGLPTRNFQVLLRAEEIRPSLDKSSYIDLICMFFFFNLDFQITVFI
jgi:hypothetical protein